MGIPNRLWWFTPPRLQNNKRYAVQRFISAPEQGMTLLVQSLSSGGVPTGNRGGGLDVHDGRVA